jgi:hypothetical protein
MLLAAHLKKDKKKPWYRMSPSGATVGNDAYSRLSGLVHDAIAPPENGHTGPERLEPG